ncbi:MAG: L,D-transpeptidase [Alphaproteobacteria bacterium]|jgi:lipoprotein-anchoring transpeptidase ErfK/SrfK|nr:L,D-transpeptidase [Alphaproteobacteria bacterium]
MSITRRAVMFSAIAAGLLPARQLAAQEAEPFVVKDESPKIAYKFRRREIDYDNPEPPGTIIVDPKRKFLYHLQGGGKATRYGVAVGKSSKSWKGEAVIKRMAKWPVWVPTPEHLEAIPSLAKHLNGMPGGLDNPMGARALYLYEGDVDTINRIHGAAKPSEIGRNVTAGCIGMLNVDVIHLYDRVELGTRVIML